MRSSHVARAAVGVVALLLAVALAGCEDEEDPPEPIESSSEPAPPSTSTTAEPTPTGPVEPTLPAEADGDSRTGVEAFVRFYWDVVNYATKTGETELLERLAQPSCDTCEAGIEGIHRVYGRGGRITGGEYAVARVEPVPSGGGHWAVITHTTIGTQRTIGAGSLNGTFPGGRAKWLLGVAWVSGAWSVSTLERR